MKLLTVTNNYRQRQTVILDDGTSFDLELHFRPRQQGWIIASLVYGTFSISGTRVTVSPNILFQQKSLLPFGLACYSQGSREPMLVEDFNSGAAGLYVLSAAEVAEATRLMLGQD